MTVMSAQCNRKFQVCKQVCVYVMYLFFVYWWRPAFGSCMCKFAGSCVCLRNAFVFAHWWFALWVFSTAASCMFIECFIASCTDGQFLHFLRISMCIVYFIVHEYGGWFHYFFRMQRQGNNKRKVKKYIWFGNGRISSSHSWLYKEVQGNCARKYY